MGSGPPFVNPCVVLFWSTLGFTIGRGIVTVVDVHPTWRCTSLRGVVPVGLGEVVGDCHDAPGLQRKGLFISLFKFFQGRKTMFFLQEYGLFLLYTAEYASS